MPLWGVAARKGNQVGLPLLVQFAEVVRLDPIPHYPLRILVGVPALDAVHRAFRYVQGCRNLWYGPALIYLHQGAGSGDPGRRVFAARINRFSCSRFSVVNSMVYQFPGMAAAPPRNPKLQPDQGPRPLGPKTFDY